MKVDKNKKRQRQIKQEKTIYKKILRGLWDIGREKTQLAAWWLTGATAERLGKMP